MCTCVSKVYRLVLLPNIVALSMQEFKHHGRDTFIGERVRDFIIKYQDRLLYGTDLVSGWGENGVDGDLGKLDNTYLSDYRYFASDEEIGVPWISESTRVQGLKLPAAVLKKIFFRNAKTWYPGI